MIIPEQTLLYSLCARHVKYHVSTPQPTKDGSYALRKEILVWHLYKVAEASYLYRGPHQEPEKTWELFHEQDSRKIPHGFTARAIGRLWLWKLVLVLLFGVYVMIPLLLIHLASLLLPMLLSLATFHEVLVFDERSVHLPWQAHQSLW